MMSKPSSARRVAYAGVLAALSVSLLYLVTVLPTMRLSVLFILALLPVTLAAERRWADAAMGFAAAALLSGLLIGPRGVWLLYVVFFGWYGIAREYVFMKWGRLWTWVVMVVLFNIALFTLTFFAKLLVLDLKLPAALLIPAAEAGFVLFELLFGMCREYYMKHVRKLIIR